jgi:hypothetical protein
VVAPCDRYAAGYRGSVRRRNLPSCRKIAFLRGTSPVAPLLRKAAVRFFCVAHNARIMVLTILAADGLNALLKSRMAEIFRPFKITAGVRKADVALRVVAAIRGASFGGSGVASHSPMMNWAKRLDAIPEFCVGHKVYFPRHQCALLKLFRLQYRGTKNRDGRVTSFSNTRQAGYAVKALLAHTHSRDSKGEHR